MTKKFVQNSSGADLPADLSPKQVAQALGVSESSLKRWCDRGDIAVTKTAGGHRRIPREAVVRFLRDHGMEAKQPDLLGIPAGARLAARQESEVLPRMISTLERGDERELSALLTGLFLANTTVAEIADNFIGTAFTAIGDKWSHGELEIYQEHRAVAVTLSALGKLGAFLPIPSAAAPVAMSATLSGDPYTLSLTLIELALREIGWNTIQLGPDHPADTLAAAIDDIQPRLLCINVSHIANEARLLAGLEQLYEVASTTGTALAIGGGALDERLRRQIRCTAHCRTIADLIGLSRGLEPHL